MSRKRRERSFVKDEAEAPFVGSIEVLGGGSQLSQHPNRTSAAGNV
jgi:hypothetical protein